MDFAAAGPGGLARAALMESGEHALPALERRRRDPPETVAAGRRVCLFV